eukprot:8914483-Pyramimonas_sp.AAC.1
MQLSEKYITRDSEFGKHAIAVHAAKSIAIQALTGNGGAQAIAVQAVTRERAIDKSISFEHKSDTIRSSMVWGMGRLLLDNSLLSSRLIGIELTTQR